MTFLVPENKKRDKFQSFHPKTKYRKTSLKNNLLILGKGVIGFQVLDTGLSFCTNSTLCNDNAFWTLFWCDKHTKAGMRKNISSIFV